MDEAAAEDVDEADVKVPRTADVGQAIEDSDNSGRFRRRNTSTAIRQGTRRCANRRSGSLSTGSSTEAQNSCSQRGEGGSAQSRRPGRQRAAAMKMTTRATKIDHTRPRRVHSRPSGEYCSNSSRRRKRQVAAKSKAFSTVYKPSAVCNPPRTPRRTLSQLAAFSAYLHDSNKASILLGCPANSVSYCRGCCCLAALWATCCVGPAGRLRAVLLRAVLLRGLWQERAS